MLSLRSWQGFPALLVSAGILSTALSPFTVSAPVGAQSAPMTIAQLFPPPPSSQVAIPAGTQLPVRYDQAEKIVVAPNETLPLTLTINRNIRSGNGTLLIPAGSQVIGQLQPAQGGSQFVANTLVFPDGSRQPINANSEVVTTTQEVVPGVNTDAVWKGAAIGAGAATIISGITGNRRITLGKILLGSGAGALGGVLFGKRRAEVIVIDANRDLTLTLATALTLN